MPNQKELLKSHSEIIGHSLLIDSTEVILTIDRNTTIVDISNYKAKLKEVNIDLNIDKIEYDTDNKIKSLAINVNCNDGYQGWTEKGLNGNEKIGFFRIYDKPGKQPFAMYPLEFNVQMSVDSSTTYVTTDDKMARATQYRTGLNEQMDKVVLTIDQNTTQDDLETYRKKLKLRNIDFKVVELDWDDQTKKIKKIEFSVNCNDGFKGSMKEEFDSMNEGSEISKIVGFSRNYNRNSESPFFMIPQITPMNSIKK